MNKKNFKNYLHQMVKNDYGFELYQADDKIIRLNFYHLNSVYNAFCTSIKHKDGWYSPTINWQYAKPNNKIANYAKKIVGFMVDYQLSYENIDWCIKEIEYYSKLSDCVFKAKYTTEVNLHTDSEN